MKRKLVCLFLAVCLLASLGVTAYASGTTHHAADLQVGDLVRVGDTIDYGTTAADGMYFNFGNTYFGIYKDAANWWNAMLLADSWSFGDRIGSLNDLASDYFVVNRIFRVSDTTTVSDGGSFALDIYFEPHIHEWQVNQESAKGTATCNACGAKVTLSAASATTAKAVGECVTLDKTDDVSLAYTVDIRKLGEPGTEPQNVDASCKEEGNYQAWLKLDDTHGLYANFTLTNPKTTAATGDNRPIELLVFGFAAMSVMAAAAFTVDRKRR